MRDQNPETRPDNAATVASRKSRCGRAAGKHVTAASATRKTPAPLRMAPSDFETEDENVGMLSPRERLARLEAFSAA